MRGEETARQAWLAAAATVAVAFLVRVPLMTHGAASFDGDEALKGVMALDALHGRGLPLVPYGAAWGLSVFETLAHLVFAIPFGLSELTMQAAMFSLWIAGVLILRAAVRRIDGPATATVATALLMTMPAWVRPSFASWGYNIAAFVFVCCGVYAVSLAREAPGARWWIALGIALGGAALTQPIAAIALAAFAAFLVPLRNRGVVISAAVAAFLIALFVLLRPRDAYWAPAIVTGSAPWNALTELPRRWFVALGGAYFQGRAFPLPPVAAFAAVLWSAALILGLVAAWRPRTNPLASACAAAVLAVSAFTLAVDPQHFGFRYLLPACTFVAAGVAACMSRWRRPRATHTAAILLAIAGIAAALAIRDLSFAGSGFTDAPSERAALEQLVTVLEDRGIRHVYAGSPYLQWKIMFSSRGRVIARWRDPHDRRPDLVRAVDDALKRGERVAMVAETHDLEGTAAWIRSSGYDGRPPITVGPGFFILESPSRAFIARYFRLNE